MLLFDVGPEILKELEPNLISKWAPWLMRDLDNPEKREIAMESLFNKLLKSYPRSLALKLMLVGPLLAEHRAINKLLNVRYELESIMPEIISISEAVELADIESGGSMSTAERNLLKEALRNFELMYPIDGVMTEEEWKYEYTLRDC